MIPSHKIIGFVTLFWTPVLGTLLALFGLGLFASLLELEPSPERQVAPVVHIQETPEQPIKQQQPIAQKKENPDMARLLRELERAMEEKRAKARRARNKIELTSKMTFTAAMYQLSYIQEQRDARTRSRNKIRSTSSFGLTSLASTDAIGPHYSPADIANHVVEEIPVVNARGTKLTRRPVVMTR